MVIDCSKVARSCLKTPFFKIDSYDVDDLMIMMMMITTCHRERGTCSLQPCRIPCTGRTACLSRGSQLRPPDVVDHQVNTSMMEISRSLSPGSSGSSSDWQISARGCSESLSWIRALRTSSPLKNHMSPRMVWAANISTTMNFQVSRWMPMKLWWWWWW